MVGAKCAFSGSELEVAVGRHVPRPLVWALIDAARQKAMYESSELIPDSRAGRPRRATVTIAVALET